ncbi:MAG: PleD family two-component system response regulator [Bdellovibrionales bacterium]
MALRVLLADESPTIKKVMQISLQDFGVDLKTVQLGIDVLQVAKQFQPDIIFVDVLLQKKNGYEVCQLLKADKETNAIPVVLMWSGFMDLDDTKFTECGANHQLEKPFDADALRNIVKTFVKKTGSQDLAKFLVFPESGEEGSKKASAPQHRELPPEATAATQMASSTGSIKPPPAPPTTPRNWNMDSFEDMDQFKEFDRNSVLGGTVNLSDDLSVPMSAEAPALQTEKHSSPPLDVDGFTHRSLKKLGKEIRKQEPEESLNQSHTPEDQLSHTELLASVAMNEKDLQKLKVEKAASQAKAPVTQDPFMASMPQLSEEQIELIIRSQSKEIIEKIVWKLVPDIAQQLIKKEISRLMDETKL